MKRLLAAVVLAITAVAIALGRRRVPEYADAAEYLAELEGEALPPRDPYVEGLR